MAYAALQELFRTQSQLVAATCEELVADHGAIAAAVAFFFRHEAPGRLPEPPEDEALQAFVAAFRAALQQKKRGLGSLLHAGVLDLLIEGVAFEAGDGLEVVDAPADAAPQPPLIPMSLVGKTKKYRSDNDAKSESTRLRNWKILTYATMRAHFMHQFARADLPAAPPPERRLQLINMPAIYSTDIAMHMAKRAECSSAAAVTNCVVIDIAVHQIDAQTAAHRITGYGAAVVTVKFDEDGSVCDTFFLREMPTMLDEWLRLPTPREELRNRRKNETLFHAKWSKNTATPSLLRDGVISGSLGCPEQGFLPYNAPMYKPLSHRCTCLSDAQREPL